MRRADALAEQFRSTSGQLRQLGTETDLRIGETVNQVNGKLEAIANLNQQIAAHPGQRQAALGPARPARQADRRGCRQPAGHPHRAVGRQRQPLFRSRPCAGARPQRIEAGDPGRSARSRASCRSRSRSAARASRPMPPRSAPASLPGWSGSATRTWRRRRRGWGNWPRRLRVPTTRSRPLGLDAGRQRRRRAVRVADGRRPMRRRGNSGNAALGRGGRRCVAVAGHRLPAQFRRQPVPLESLADGKVTTLASLPATSTASRSRSPPAA